MKNYPEAKKLKNLYKNEITYATAVSKRNEYIWQKIGDVTIFQSIDIWLKTLSPLTRKNYGSAFRKLIEYKFVQPEFTLQQFSLLNHESILDDIKLVNDWQEATRQARAAAYISFTGYLQRKTQGLIKKVTTNKDGTAKTFYKIREKVKTKALTEDQTKKFLNILSKINKRDTLIAKVILQGGKRKSEVLELRFHNINFIKNQITFRQTKTKGIYKETIITYPQSVMEDLKNYIGVRTGLVFITRNGNRVHPQQIDRSFVRAGLEAGISFRTTPHVLRATLVTRLKENKVQDTDIMKITGHVNPAQLIAYDKSDIADNASTRYNLVE